MGTGAGGAAVLPTPACQADPSAVIAALPARATFHGSGCYDVPKGILLTKPVTIDGGTYIDSSASLRGQGWPGMKPVILVQGTRDVTLKNLHVIGGNPAGSFHAPLVGQAGIKVESSDHVTITRVTTANTFGDALELWNNWPAEGRPVTNLVVNGLTVTNAGRQGITPGDVYKAFLTNVRVVSSADSGIDFESDLAHVGAGNVTITNSTFRGGSGSTAINMIEYLSGPVAFVDCTLLGHIVVADPQSSFPVTITSGTIHVPAYDPGTPRAGIFVNTGGTLVITNVPISLLPHSGTPTGRVWMALRPANLTFNHSSIAGPPGTHDATGIVTVTP